MGTAARTEREELRFLSVVGARPQFVKASVVMEATRRAGVLHHDLIHTGQHYDENLSDVFFRELAMPEPTHNLEVGSGPHGQQTGRMIEKLERVLLEERPHWVVLYGDTNSTLAGAIAASKLGIPIAHVEAGLRSGQRKMAEEINRVVTDRLSTALFCPTPTAMRNLVAEGIVPASADVDCIAIDEARAIGSHRAGSDGAIAVNVGDVMYDAALKFAGRATTESRVHEKLGLRDGKYVLATVHRAENTDAPHALTAIIEGLCRVGEILPVVLPLHPRTRAALGDAGQRISSSPGLIVLEPLGYLDMLRLERGARLVVTDSGGVQKEAYFSRVPCVTLRDATEWVELVDAGWNTLVPPSSASAVWAAIARLLEAPRPNTRVATFGEGDAADKIAEVLLPWRVAP